MSEKFTNALMAMRQDLTLREFADLYWMLGLTPKLRLVRLCPFLADAWRRKARRERGTR